MYEKRSVGCMQNFGPFQSRVMINERMTLQIGKDLFQQKKKNWQGFHDGFLSVLQVTPDVHFQNDLGLDSLDNVEIVMALEEEFKLEIPDLEADKIDSCRLAIEYIHNHPMAG